MYMCFTIDALYKYVYGCTVMPLICVYLHIVWFSLIVKCFEFESLKLVKALNKFIIIIIKQQCLSGITSIATLLVISHL